MDILFPISCLSCTKEFDTYLNSTEFISPWLCHACYSEISLRNALFCPFCDARSAFHDQKHRKCREQTALDGMLIALSYSHPTIRIIIAHLKYHGVKDLASLLSQFIVRYIKILSFPVNTYILIPIPISSHRKRSRGYNQAEEIAYHVGRHFNIPVYTHVLRKIRNTPPQTSLHSDKERRDNVYNSYAINDPDSIRGKMILLVDDVITSGATMRECARILRNAKPKALWGLSAAGRR